MIVFWSSDPESTNGYASGLEGTQRRFWAKELGIEFVHIDPHLNPTAQLYGGRWIAIKARHRLRARHRDHERLGRRGAVRRQLRRDTERPASRNGAITCSACDDGIAKTPEWQDAETGVSAHVVRALARAWARKKTYLGAGGLGAGFGGACRSATGSQWARCMILLMAMRGWASPASTSETCRRARRSITTSTFRVMPRAESPVSSTSPPPRCNNYLPHAACAHHQSGEADDSAAALRRRDRGRTCEGYPVGWTRPGGAIRALSSYPMPGILEDSHDLSLWSIGLRHHRGVGPLRRQLPASSRIDMRCQPVDLDGGRCAVRGRDLAGMHLIRTMGHQRLG